MIGLIQGASVAGCDGSLNKKKGFNMIVKALQPAKVFTFL
jgi:hypothetical protein